MRRGGGANGTQSTENADDTADDTEETLIGWVTAEDGVYYYGEDGVMYAGDWYVIDGNRYFFNNSGRLHYGWRTASDGNKYYCDPDTGVMMTGWVKIGGSRYFFNNSGRLHYGWRTASDGNKYYCSKKTGAMMTGWVTINGLKYFFNNSGRLHYGWRTASDGNKYYCSMKTGVMMTGWVTINGLKYFFNNSGRLHYGWRTASDGNKYYCSTKTGVMQTGYVTINGVTYYFDTTTGALSTPPVTNQITGNAATGYYYVDSTGTRVTSEEITYAVQFVIAHSTAGASNATRLKECYDYLWQNYPYNRTYETPDASTMSDEAIAIFSNGYGNCYKYAAAFACIAKVLGYETRVCVGQISARSGGMTPHGWTEVKVNGSWYLCDPDMQMNYPTRNVYMVTESSYPYTHTVTTKYTLTVSNGIVTWQ